MGKLLLNNREYSGSGGASDLDELSDVTITSVTTGQVLKYNGSDWVNSNESSGGHTILDNEGDTLTQQPNLQFLGAYSENDSVNSKTKVNVVRSMTTAQFNQLSSDEKVGLINITDSGIGINELSDVDIDSGTIADGQALVYDGTNHEWVNGTVGSASALGDLTDVDITTPTDGQALVYDSNSGEWVNGTVLTTVDADDVSFDDTSVDFSASDVQAAFENIRVTLTQAEYDLLSPAEQNNGTIYYISDTNGDGQQFQPIIYSETEREIGVFTDGKPLYQKTFIFPSSVTIPKETWTTVTNISSLNVDNLVSCIGQPTDSQSASVNAYNNAGNLQIFLSFAWAIRIITIQYTKTTDTAGSGTWTPQGVPAHHYSTDEQIVGTWIDGSTIYEKTIDFGTLPAQTIKGVSANIATNLDKVVCIDGIGIKSNDNTFIKLPYKATDGGTADLWYDRVGQYGLSNDCVVINTNADFSSFSGIVTLRYTKTSS